MPALSSRRRPSRPAQPKAPEVRTLTYASRDGGDLVLDLYMPPSRCGGRCRSSCSCMGAAGLAAPARPGRISSATSRRTGSRWRRSSTGSHHRTFPGERRGRQDGGPVAEGERRRARTRSGPHLPLGHVSGRSSGRRRRARAARNVRGRGQSRASPAPCGACSTPTDRRVSTSWTRRPSRSAPKLQTAGRGASTSVRWRAGRAQAAAGRGRAATVRRTGAAGHCRTTIPTSPESRLVGAPVQTVPDRVRAASPITYVEQGRAAVPDHARPGGQLRAARPERPAVRRAGGAPATTSTLRLIDGLPHTFFNRTRPRRHGRAIPDGGSRAPARRTGTPAARTVGGVRRGPRFLPEASAIGCSPLCRRSGGRVLSDPASRTTRSSPVA